MKKRIVCFLLTLAFLLCLCPAFAAAETEYVTVTLDANGGCFHNDPNYTIDTENAPKGGTSTQNGQGPGTPSREGYSFEGWYLHADGSGEEVDPWHYTPTYTQDITFYAKWKKWEPSGTCGKNLTWSFDEATGKLTIKGSGAMDDFERNRSPWSPVCEKIKSLSLPSGLTYIGNWAFNNCRELTSVSVPASVTEIGGVAFSSCYKLTSLSLPNGLTSLGSDCFAHCSSLTSVNIPNTVTKLGSYAFGYTGLTSVTVPSSVTTFYGSTFAGCTGLTSIKVEYGNQRYTTVDGMVFSKDKTELVAYPAGRKSTSYTITDGVTSVGQAAFQGCAALTSVVIPRGVTSIGWRAFAWCDKLASVTIPVTVTNIKGQAFVDDNQLKDVYYSGTKAARDKITIGSDNDKLVKATWHYGTEEAPTPQITITAQPKNAKVKAGAKAKFSVKVKQKGVTYQWYSKAPGDTEWTAVAGATKATLTVVGVTGNSGSQYRCGVTNKGTEVFSKAATLTVTPVKPKIKTQPKTAKVKSGAKAKFTVKATGPHLQYQWYKCAPGSDSWEPIPGATAATYSFTAAKTDNGWQYRCVVKNEDGSVTTKTVKVSVKLSLPKFSAQPKSAKVKSGTLVKLKVKVKGKGVSYQWYARSSKDGTWEKIDGATSATYSVTVTAANSGYQYRCEARNADGAKYSKAATLNLK